MARGDGFFVTSEVDDFALDQAFDLLVAAILVAAEQPTYLIGSPSACRGVLPAATQAL